jgi:predicted MFS family arabinose efflux permease
LATSRGLGRLRRRFGEERLLLIGGLLMAGGFLLALVLPDWRAMTVAVVALGAGFPIFHSTLQTRATELNPSARGTAISLFAFALFMGSGLGTLLLGGLLVLGGYPLILLASGLGLALLALLSPRLTRLAPT